MVSALNCVLAQRLVRKICSHCRERVRPSLQLLEESGLDPEQIVRESHRYGNHLGAEFGDDVSVILPAYAAISRT